MEVESIEVFFHSNLKYLRTKHGMTQSKLGKMLGVKASNISNYESTFNTPPLKAIIQLIQIFEVSIDDLIFKDLAKNSDIVKSKKSVKQSAETFTKKSQILQVMLDLEKKSKEINTNKELLRELSNDFHQVQNDLKKVMNYIEKEQGKPLKKEKIVRKKN